MKFSSKILKRQIFLYICLFAVSCKTRQFNVPKTSHKESETTNEIKSETTNEKKSETTNKKCIFPVASEFAPQNEVARKDALETISQLNSFAKMSGIKFLGNSSSDLKNWVLRAITPLNMGCASLIKNDVIAFGKESFVTFVDTALKLYNLEAIETNIVFPQWEGLFHPFANKKEFFEIHLLAAINSSITDNKDKNWRAQGEEVIHGVPLDETDLRAAEEIAKEGLISIESYSEKEAFKNTFGNMVYGKFLHYPHSNRVVRLLKEFSQKYSESKKSFELKSISKADYIDAVARLVRRCVTIHPFGDGNGRTCQLWGLSALVRMQIPHAVLWAGDDVLMLEKDFANQFSKGVTLHENFLGQKFPN